MGNVSVADVVDVIHSKDGGELLPWLDANQPQVEASLAARGAVLLRGFRAVQDEIAEEVMGRIGNELLEDAFWSTPRSGVAKKTFTATEYASDRSISLHCEMAYMKGWARFIAFHALEVASEGGETTVCDIDAVSADISDLVGDFATKGVTYQRTHHPGIDIAWQKAYRTESKQEVEEIGKKAGMTLNWLPGDILQTRHTAQGAIKSEKGAPIYFSQAHLFHPANLPTKAYDSLVALLGADNLPRNAFYGDGSPIAPEAIKRINEAFDRHAMKMGWQVGDVLILDNMRYAHGRMPFKGKRKLHVALANLHRDLERTPIFNAR